MLLSKSLNFSLVAEENDPEREEVASSLQQDLNRNLDLQEDEWVAVAFNTKLFVGQFQEYSSVDKLSKIHFLERSTLPNTFVWPELSDKEADISWVEDGIN